MQDQTATIDGAADTARSRRREGAARRWLRLGRWCFAVVASLVAWVRVDAVEGLPLTRFYAFEDIGRVSRGANLSFDALGRVVVVQQDEYAVLNDNVWLRLAGEEMSGLDIYRVEVDVDGTILYGALGSWGILRPTASGRLRPQPLVPADHPRWVRATNFGQILCRPEGVYLAGWNGVVFLDRRTHAHQFFEFKGLSRIFVNNGRIFVAAHGARAVELDVAHGTVREPPGQPFGETVISYYAGRDGGPALAGSARRLYAVRAGRLEPLTGPLSGYMPGPIRDLIQLADGDFAVSIDNRGLFILDGNGEVKHALTSPQFAGITRLANHEPGVLWAANETGLCKVLYGQPFTIFGQALGLPVNWPQLVSWRGRLVIATGGRLYEPRELRPHEPTQFQLLPGGPDLGAWAIAVVGDTLLAGNSDGVFARLPGGEFVCVAPGLNTARLIPLDDSTCLAIDSDTIGALRREDGVWRECAPRVAGVGYPSIVHSGRGSGWIELGVNRAARVSLDGGRIQVRLFESFPWPQPHWVNVSVVGSIAVLIGSEGKHVCFDEITATEVDPPALRELLDGAQEPIQRLCEDDRGTLWVSHGHGIQPYTKQNGRYVRGPDSYAGLQERTPVIRALPGGEIWVSTGFTLFHLTRTDEPADPPRFRPTLAGIRDNRTNTLLYEPAQGRFPDTIPYERNSLAFEFFAGSYAAARPLAYESRLNDGPWMLANPGYAIGLSDLAAGAYRLSVRVVDSQGPLGAPTELRFTVSPPWYRRWYALISYPLLAAALVFALLRFFMRRAKAHNAALQQQVAERSNELQATLRKLQQETRTSATLAERNRLAGEIHDSLEQGFTGLTLQLETTAAFDNCPAEVKSGLAVALNMVAFSRKEVRNAVRDMHSPMLATADLETALRQLVAQLGTPTDYATMRREGTPRRLSSSVEHHLLRIAQEAVANAVKHASARHLEIVLRFHSNEVQLDIRDDGCGFDPAAVLNGEIGHFGLPSFRGRASRIGGAVEIASEPGAGTRITVRAPVDSTPTL